MKVSVKVVVVPVAKSAAFVDDTRSSSVSALTSNYGFYPPDKKWMRLVVPKDNRVRISPLIFPNSTKSRARCGRSKLSGQNLVRSLCTDESRSTIGWNNRVSTTRETARGSFHSLLSMSLLLLARLQRRQAPRVHSFGARASIQQGHHHPSARSGSRSHRKAGFLGFGVDRRVRRKLARSQRHQYPPVPRRKSGAERAHLLCPQRWLLPEDVCC